MKHILAILLLAGIAMPAIAAEKSNAKKKSGEAAKEKTAEKAPTKAELAAKSLTAAQRTKLLKTLNEGDEKALNALPGVGEVIAAAIKKARPIKEVPDLMKVDGIGEETYNDILKHAKSGAPAEEKKTESKSKKKSTTKK
jgi:DNA uptake protein ComE-like DNA-binding protein